MQERSDRVTGFVFTCAVAFVLSGAVAATCYEEKDDCTVCYHAGANILCSSGGGGSITCPDEIIGTDPPFRKVVQGTQGWTNKRSENYGSCQWQPRKKNPVSDDPPCVDDGPQQEKLNVLGEETYGDSCKEH